MSHPISEYNYTLPIQYIAQHPANPRESANLMLLNRKSGEIAHRKVDNLIEYLHSGDVVVLNNTKVFHARLHGSIGTSRVELFLVKPTDATSWLALGKPGKKIQVGNDIRIAPDFTARVVEKKLDGTLIVRFPYDSTSVITKANQYGEVPVPPYIKTIPTDEEYQTVYAKQVGSVAAPTAGFHLTQNILLRLREKGVNVLEITLHVGLGTFLPVKSVTIEEHSMHSEWAEISEKVARIINDAKQRKCRIIAVGTTTVRTLEGVASLHNGTLVPYRGDIDIFIKPGFQFQICDAMLTNFHLPKSTLIILVSAFAGREHILRAYKEAVENKYRFYSFGDAMLIS
jgi:S-adenosylmethionine:tRNA ribosyltransferase-isomerase